MCLAVCGTILSIGSADRKPAPGDPPATPRGTVLEPDDPLLRLAEVDFGGVLQQVSLACLPDARVGDRVLVHVGLALCRVESEEPLPQVAPTDDC